MYPIYRECPVFQNEALTLRLIDKADAHELMVCYGDAAAVPFFNGDNCAKGAEGFFCADERQMENMIRLWQQSYKTRQFVRMTIRRRADANAVGTVEMFNRGAWPHYGVHGILRVDLAPGWEDEETVGSVLALANEHFYREFGVESILTKAPAQAQARRAALKAAGYVPAEHFSLPDYYIREDE
ncbi:MAG: N-acetyltransferase [Eubacteriales bacterium]|nr:N-acetyltransferase [Eubacteriales bacterium]